MTEPSYRVAPLGFTLTQWREFREMGYLVLPSVLDAVHLDDLTRAVDQIATDHSLDPNRDFLYAENVVEQQRALADLIDHAGHVGFVYDIFGELLKLQRSQIFIRPRGRGRSSSWHIDGPRAAPYRAFTDMPLQVKVGFWLTATPHEDMGNLVVLPGSHRRTYLPAYDTHEPVEGEVALCFKRGDLLLIDSNVWHRVQYNHTDVVRKNIFLTYSPSWVTCGDRFRSDQDWLTTLSREQRIIMRQYDQAFRQACPPDEDFPLFLDRETQLDRDQDCYPERIRLDRRKRRTRIEKWGEVNTEESLSHSH